MMGVNKMFGKDKETNKTTLDLIGLDMSDFGRFRACFKEDNIIIVRTRIGGGNREYNEDTIDSLRKNNFYIEDFDDEDDSTYAWFKFEIKEESA